MNRELLHVEELTARVHDIWLNQWFLLTCGDFSKGDFNTMTVAWGSLGVMWNMPFVQVVVRPTRYTYEFMEKYDSFTLCAFPEQYRKKLQFIGTNSGRDGDKVVDSGLKAIASTRVAAPGFDESELLLECQKMYWDDINPERFLDPRIDNKYPLKDYHRIYYGHIVAILATEKWKR
jgi:flavin reductase (DIM6/NTAB) family NADH-FMN oxidoreductase RutF